MQGGGFEPPKAEPAGLQPAPFGHSGIPARRAIVAASRITPYDRGVERFDVLVVGAGPAGSATALHLARSGARVLLVDKARFPRDKPCGGGLTGRALKHVPCDVDAGGRARRRSDGHARRVPRRRSRGRADEPLIAMTQRRRLDLHLAEQAAAAGVDFRDGASVSDLELDDDRRFCTCRRVARAGRVPRRGRRCQRHRRARGRARRRDRSRCRARGERALGRRSSAALRDAPPGSSSASCPAATAGCFRRATMRTSASAAGWRRGHGCAITSTAWRARTRVDPAR